MNEYYEAVLTLNELAEKNDWPHELRFSYLTDGNVEIIRMGEMQLFNDQADNLYYVKKVGDDEIEAPLTVLEFCKRAVGQLKNTIQNLKLK